MISLHVQAILLPVVPVVPHNVTFQVFIYSSLVLMLVHLIQIDGRQSTGSTSTWARPHILRPTYRFSNDDKWTIEPPFTSSCNILDFNRGGSVDEVPSTTNDEERYSRQVYTLGAKAHGLIRIATVYIDGPSQSGLVYECAKNLALSGVRRIIFLTNDRLDNENHMNEHGYYCPELDDLGRTYQRGAKAEIFDDSDVDVSDTTLLIEYVRRLNPSIIVSELQRSTLLETLHPFHSKNNKHTVLMCIDRPISTTESLNEVARQHQWSFVATETAGVFGNVFCDFGANFVVDDPDGETPLNTPLDRIDIDAQCDTKIIVYCVDGERHDVSKGDLIRFQYRDGETSKDFSIVVVDVQTPFRFVAKLVDYDTNTIQDFVTKINVDAVSFFRVKSPLTLSFDTIKSATKLARTKGEMFTPCDLDKSYDMQRRWASMLCFHAISEFIQEERRLPVNSDKDIFISLVQKSWPSNDFDERALQHIDVFLRTCAAKFSPLQSVFGAISAQEVLKAVTGLYYPVHQFMLYDCDEILNYDEVSCTTMDPTTSHIDTPGLRYILGDVTVNKLQSTKIFVVGSGAIGCEILKNLAAMGVGTMNDGKVVVTDMDTIEKSNLSRQLLFRDGDLGKFKSTAARDAVLRLDPSIQIDAHSCKVGDSTGNNSFDESFWSDGVDVILNALDNVEARVFMDKQCVANKKALIDAGTMGPKGNVQVVVPHLSESYASSIDPPEPSIPLCTIKNFPYSIAHTIQWGRDLFEGLFHRRPQQANDFLENLNSTELDHVAAKLAQEKTPESAVEIIKELQEDLSIDTIYVGVDFLVVKTKALLWAIELSYKLYYVEPTELLKKHPLGSLDDEGLPFWSGSRRPPRFLTFNAFSSHRDQVTVDENFVEFVRNGARLRIESLVGKSFDRSDLFSTAAEVREKCTAFFSSITNPHNENEDDSWDDKRDSRNVKEALERIVPRQQRMISIDFEKDNDLNGHVAFVNAASNLRAMVFGIPIVDALETRRVAGKIVPAMISTTAFVSALSCTELVKIVQNVGLKRYRNAFINLALPFFAFTVPLPAEKMPGLDGNHYTLWDQLSVNESKKSALAGGITVKLLRKQIKRLASNDPARVSVVSISAGPYLLYANFLHDEDDDVLLSSLWVQVKDAISSSDAFVEEHSRDMNDYSIDLDIDDSYIDLTVVVEDVETGDEVELPPLRVHRFRQ